MSSSELIQRWRLVLGRLAEPELGPPPDGRAQRVDEALDYLYGREYAARGLRGRSAGLTVPEWIAEVRELFPRQTIEVVERHALERYGLTELVTDPDTLARLEPSYPLLRALLSVKGSLQGRALEQARRVVRQVVDELTRRLSRHVRQVLWGRLNRRRRTRWRGSRALDWRTTVKDNLRHYDPERRRLVVERLHFFARLRQSMPWHIILAVDSSGSMLNSVIHSAVMASILAGLPTVRVSLVAFDTRVVDLSEQVRDAVEVLMTVQLGGGTDIAGALGYCERLVQYPGRTVVVLVTDFYEGGPARGLLVAVRRLREAGVRVLGLAALDAEAQPCYDRALAEECVAAGAEVAAMTPEQLTEWLAGVLS